MRHGQQSSTGTSSCPLAQGRACALALGLRRCLRHSLSLGQERLHTLKPCADCICNAQCNPLKLLILGKAGP